MILDTILQKACDQARGFTLSWFLKSVLQANVPPDGQVQSDKGHRILFRFGFADQLKLSPLLTENIPLSHYSDVVCIYGDAINPSYPGGIQHVACFVIDFKNDIVHLFCGEDGIEMDNELEQRVMGLDFIGVTGMFQHFVAFTRASIDVIGLLDGGKPMEMPITDLTKLS